MSVVLKPPQRRSCPAGREGHRYWSSEEWSDETCHLDIEWEENGKNVMWEVSFVDTVASMNKWMNIYAQDVLMFDCEWSKKNGVGVIQFATPPELHQVLVVDCTRVTLAEVRNLFERCKMVGWATGNDIRHLNLDTSGRNVVDLQELTTQNSEFWANWKEEDSIRVEEYQHLTDTATHIREHGVWMIWHSVFWDILSRYQYTSILNGANRLGNSRTLISTMLLMMSLVLHISTIN